MTHWRATLARLDTIETALAAVLAIWGLWGLLPATARYMETPAFTGMHAFAPPGVWGALMLGTAALLLVALLTRARRVRIAGLLAMLILWMVLLVALSSAAIPPPGAGIDWVYIALTAIALWRRGHRWT